MVRFACQYVYVCVCFFTLTLSVNMKCAGELLSTVSSVCSNTQQLVSWKHLSHPLDCYTMVQFQAFLWSRELTQRDLCVNWIPMQVWSCNHLVPHHFWVEGQPGRDNWRAFKPLSLKTDSKGTMATWQIHTSWIKLSYTGLLWCIPVFDSCNCIAKIIREGQGYYCMEYLQLVW